MHQPQIQFTNGQQDQLLAKFVCFCARGIQIGKYPEGNFLILPFLPKGHPKAIYLPNFSYSNKFWKKLSFLKDYSLTKPYPEVLISEIQRHLNSYTFPNIKPTITAWNKISVDFFKSLNTVFDSSILNKINSFTILLTDLGSSGAFSKLKLPNGKYDFICTHRIDMPVENLTQIIIQAIISATQPGYTDIGTIGWYQRNAIINFLSTYTPLKKYSLPLNYTVPNLKLQKQNDQYLSQLGFPKNTDFQMEKLENDLSKQELNLFLCLKNKPGTLVSFDEAALAIWNSDVDEKFSLYALAKIVESLRDKIRKFGIKRQVIHTKRKQGYIYLQ